MYAPTTDTDFLNVTVQELKAGQRKLPVQELCSLNRSTGCAKLLTPSLSS
jgi:hypothetical protein